VQSNTFLVSRETGNLNVYDIMLQHYVNKINNEYKNRASLFVVQ